VPAEPRQAMQAEQEILGQRQKISNNQFRDGMLNKRSMTVLCWS
jgi:hypothetical protein